MKIKKSLSWILIIIFVFMAVTNSVMALNVLHDDCDIKLCNVCSLINHATDYLHVLSLSSGVLLILRGFVYIINMKLKNIFLKCRNTLIEYKVQLNE